MSRFLQRWSQRKRAAEAAPQTGPEPPVVPVPLADAGAPPAPASEAQAQPPALELPALEDLNLDSDFSGFLKEEVSEALRRQALKKLFSDPHFNRMDGLDIYIDDYSIPDPIPPDILKRIGHAREWLDEVASEAEAEADAEAVVEAVVEVIVEGDADVVAAAPVEEAASVPAAEEAADSEPPAGAGEGARPA